MFQPGRNFKMYNWITFLNKSICMSCVCVDVTDMLNCDILAL